MISWWNIYLIIAFTGMGFALVYTPLCKILANKMEFLDKPAEQKHKGHKEPIPLLGGLAICLAVISTVIFGFIAVQSLHKDVISPYVLKTLPGVTKITNRMLFIGLGAILATLLGLYDDKFNMSAKTKLFGQIAIAVIAVHWGGVHISAFINNELVTWFISVFWIILIINAVNFFDNMDGLAVGVAAIAFSLFTIAAAMRGQYFVAALGATAAGASIGFWFFNHSPASIFMGDSGSHLLGYMLAVMGCMVTYYKTESDSRFSVLIPFFILALPLFDLFAVSVIRLKIGKPVYIGDHNHISHRFLRMGMSRKMAVLMVHLLALIIGMCVLPLLWGKDPRTTVVSLVQAVTILLLISLLQYSGRKD